VERLWHALGRGDWAGMRAQFLPGARIWQAETGTSLGPGEYVARHRAEGAARVRLEHVLLESDTAAVEVHVSRGADERRCAGFYDLRDGRIARGAEYWAAAGERPAGLD
jgi:ketosteroid isomerase-like protein